MKEKTIIDLVERGEKLCIGVRYNQNNEEYTVYLATESHEFIEDINIWSGGRLKVFADPRRILSWAKNLGMKSVFFEDINF